MSWIEMITAIMISVILLTMIAAYFLQRAVDKIFEDIGGLCEIISLIIEKLNPGHKS